MMLPMLDGLSVCEEIHRNSVTARIPVIMVSAYDGPATRAAGMAAGAVGFLPKPIDFNTLPIRINDAIRSRRYFLANMAKASASGG
jgi:DNA-binding response OmpR family regulator